MLKAAYNELELTVRLRGHSALLVKDGRYTKKEKDEWHLSGSDHPHAIFMSRESKEGLRTALQHRRYGELTYFIPGSSLKGAFRAHLERVLRGMAEPGMERVCDPFDEDHSCSKVMATQGESHADFPYKGACPICRLFGYTSQAGRIRFSDAIRHGGTPTLVQNVSISRQTGSVIDPHFSMAIVNADFEFKALLRNFELWHLGLLGALFTDLGHRRVGLGSAKSRGFGEVIATVPEAKLTYLGTAATRQHLVGIGELVSPNESERYGFAPAQVGAALPLLQHLQIEGLAVPALPWRASYLLDAERLWAASLPYFSGTWWNDHSGLLSDRAARGFKAAALPEEAE